MRQVESQGLVADLGVRGVWRPLSEALFDIRVVDTDAQSYACWSVNPVFSPFVASVDGLLACEARYTVQRFADRQAFHLLDRANHTVK